MLKLMNFPQGSNPTLKLPHPEGEEVEVDAMKNAARIFKRFWRERLLATRHKKASRALAEQEAAVAKEEGGG